MKPGPDPRTITILLAAARQGSEHAAEELMNAVYSELRRMAQRQMKGERGDHTLQPTALVHETYLRLLKTENVEWADRSHFFCVAASIMRRILVDHARSHKTKKRGGAACKIELSDWLVYSEQNSDELLSLNDALEKLHQFAPRQSRLIELHFFGGLTFDESAAILGVSSKTAKRDWWAARTWLHGEINGWPNDTRTLE